MRLSLGLSTDSVSTQKVGGSFTGILDEFTGAAAAYSVRQLKASATNSMRVRKEVSSVASETDIGFDSSGNLDTASLLSFASDADGGNVSTYIWYDQTGNGRNAANSTPANQPLIVRGGVLITENSKAAIDFDGVDDYFTGATKTTMNNTAIFSVIKSDSNTQDSVLIQNSVDSNNCVALGLGDKGSSSAIGSRLRISGQGDYVVGDSTFTATDQTLVSYLADDTVGQMFVDGTEETNSVDSRSGGSGTTIGARGDGTKPFNGAIQEVIFFDSDQSLNRTSIEANINSYF